MDGIPLVDQLTAAGRGAVAVVRLRSSDLDVLNDRFVSASGKLPGAQPIGRILFGKWGDEEIVIVRTGESEWEINCHGGEAAVGKICDDLAGNKTRQTSSIDHAITNQLIRCRSRRTAEYLLAQSEGVFRSFLQTLRSTQDVQLAAEQIQSVMSRQAFAEHLVEQWKMAIVGQPNAGKSSLLNALIGYERAIVFDQPGTTRDRIEAELIIDGWPVQAVDTAGIRVTNDAIESEGVAAAQSSIADCDVCLLVVDSTIGWSAADAEIASGISERTPTAILFNKSDLATNPSFTTGIGGVSEQKISATNGDGIPTLLEWISAAVVPQPPAIDEPLPVIAELTRAFAEFQNSDDLQQLHDALKRWL